MNDWKQVLSAARKEYSELVQQRDVIDADQADLDVRREKVEKRILQLQKTIESLSELLGESTLAKTLAERLPLGGAYDNLKLAEAVRKVLQSGDRYWSPIEVREALQVQQYDLAGYTNALASIHAVLKRIYESGDAVRMPGHEGKAVYRWKALKSEDSLSERYEIERPTKGPAAFQHSPLKHIGKRGVKE